MIVRDSVQYSIYSPNYKIHVSNDRNDVYVYNYFVNNSSDILHPF